MSNLHLIGKKLGMTREFYSSGLSVPVTVLKMEKARVIALIDKEKRGYSAIQIGFGNIKSSKLTKQMKGFFARTHLYENISFTFSKKDLSVLLGAGLKLSSSIIFLKNCFCYLFNSFGVHTFT